MDDVASDRSANVNNDTLSRLYDDPEEQISQLLAYRPEDDDVEQKRLVFRALANEDRVRVLESLRHGERCGCELRAILDAPQSTVATHLRQLSDAGLVNKRKKGKWTYYRIADTAVMDILDLAGSLQEG